MALQIIRVIAINVRRGRPIRISRERDARQNIDKRESASRQNSHLGVSCTDVPLYGFEQNGKYLAIEEIEQRNEAQKR
jgi:hypothetical protein